MPDIFITLEEAASFEGVSYDTIQKRVKRNPEQYTMKTQAREGGGKEQVMVSVSSLSAKARKAQRAAARGLVRDTIIDGRTDARPWYIDADLNQFTSRHEAEFRAAFLLADQVQSFMSYTGPDKTGQAERTAQALGVSWPTLYRYTRGLLEANAWALRMEKEDGQSRDYFRALALCRKPKEGGTFPSLTPEQKAVIENIWFDKDFANNLGTMEMLFEDFQTEAERRSWPEYPSYKTVTRYVKHLMDRPGAASAHYLAANGLQEWTNKMQIKGKRDATTLEVMEYVVADAHTFDVWVSYTAPNGKVKAIRPVLVSWLDMKSRRFLGNILCEHSNTQIVKESFVKMVYEAGVVPKHVHMDNGKDFANRETLGQDRDLRGMDAALMDAEFKGFYLAMGAEDWSRSLPFQPWDKPIERGFNTFCLRYSRKFASYTGTLTTSKTAAKRKKPIQAMLERGELLTMEEFMDALEAWLASDYDQREHRGLKDSGEQWTTPGAVWANAARHDKAAPPREYAAMLLMKPDTARVTSQGINKFKTLYTAQELGLYKDKTVGVRWDVDDVRQLYVYDLNTGRKICEAYSAQYLQFGDRVSQAALDELFRRKNHNLKTVREIQADMTTPYEQRLDPSVPAAVGKLDLTIKAKRPAKVVTLPVDKEFRGEMEHGRARKKDGSEFLDRKADAALTRLRAMG